MAEILIPVSDPKSHNSQALGWAAFGGHQEIVELLIPVSDVDAACESLDEAELAMVRAVEAKLKMKELQASTVQIQQSFNQCVDQAKSESQGTATPQRGQARRL